MSRSRWASRGQATPLIVGVIAVLAVFVLGLAQLGRTATDAARARTAADAAALAGTTGGRSGAANAAASNGGVLVDFQRLGDDVLVTVRVGNATARARAARNGGAVAVAAGRPASGALGTLATSGAGWARTLADRGRLRPPR